MGFFLIFIFGLLISTEIRGNGLDTQVMGRLRQRIRSSWALRAISGSVKIISHVSYRRPAVFKRPIVISECIFKKGLILSNMSKVDRSIVFGRVNIKQSEVILELSNIDQVVFSGKLHIRGCHIGEIIIEGSNSELYIDEVTVMGNIICKDPSIKVHANTPELLAKVKLKS